MIQTSSMLFRRNLLQHLLILRHFFFAILNGLKMLILLIFERKTKLPDLHFSNSSYDKRKPVSIETQSSNKQFIFVIRVKYTKLP